MLKLLCGLCAALLCCGAIGREELAVVTEVHAPYADVRERLVRAIEEEGLVVANVSRVGDMLARTGRDLGTPNHIFANAEVLEFCSARVSRLAMTANPNAIVFCPYSIAVYSLAGQTASTYLSYRKMPSVPELEEVSALLKAIVGHASAE